MSKRNKKSRSNSSAFKLEALEQRQLLATIVAGSGTEVNSDVLLANGNTYDQILLTGSTVTVTADAGQVTRVDFLDADGDIVRAEFAGSGTLTISLADFAAAAAPENYATATEYVSGHASFRIEGSDETTNFSLHSLGSANVHNGLANPIFAGGEKTGGNNVANVSRLVIEAQDSALGSAFGGIRAGNAVFSDDSGAVGIIAPDIQFQGPIIIGDIDADDVGVAVLSIGSFSANKTVTVAGGDLVQSNDTNIENTDGNVKSLISTSGTTSFGVLLGTQVIEGGAVTGIGASDISYTSAEATVTIDGSTITQEELDEYADKFLNDVIIENGLAAGLVFGARSFGNITVEGDLAGLITTDIVEDGEGVADAGELGIGNVTIEGDILAGGAIESATWIGNVTVEGGIDYSDDELDDFDFGEWEGGFEASAIISTLGNEDHAATIGSISFDDEVDLDDIAFALVAGATSGDGASGGVGAISAKSLSASGAVTSVISTTLGSVGSITIEEGLSISGATNAVHAAKGIGAIKAESIAVSSSIVAADGAVGAITSTDGGITLGVVSATGAIGAITADGDLLLSGNITAKGVGAISAGGTVDIDGTIKSSGNIGAITAGEGDLVIDGDIQTTGTNINIGAITASEGSIEINGEITSTGSLGAISATAGDILIAAAVSADSVGAISATADESTGGNVTVEASVTATAGSIGAITLTGDDDAVVLDLSNGGSFSATAGIGHVTVDGGSILGADDQVEFSANTIGNVTVTGHADTTVLLTDVIFAAKPTDVSTEAKAKAGVESALIGNITLDSSAASGGSIASSTNPSTTATTGTGFSSAGSIGNISITTADDGGILDAGSSSLIFRAGNSNMGLASGMADEYEEGVDENGGVKIGTVSIAANLTDFDLSDGNEGSGLVIASGVANATAGRFVSGTTTVAAATKLGTGGEIGAVAIQDLGGEVGVNGFVSNTLTEDGDDADFDGGAVIIADKIASISVETGVELLDITPTGLALKGVIGVGADDAAQYEGDEATNLFVIVL